MIGRSSNDPATAIHRSVGDRGLRGVARRAGMRGFSIAGNWGNALITAADQARFFAALPRLVASRYRSFALRLLAGIVPAQRWGVPAVAGRRWRVRLKGGWRATAEGRLVHQVARLEGRGRAFTLAVFTDGNRSHADGVATVEGVSALLLGRRAFSPDSHRGR